MNVQQQEVGVRVKQKLEALLAAFDTLTEDTRSLREQNQRLEEKLKNQELVHEELQQKYNQLQLSKAVLASSGNDAQEAKSKVKRIVREIDQCIALLNR